MNPIYTMPHILTETSEGATAHSLQDELFQDRQIELVARVLCQAWKQALGRAGIPGLYGPLRLPA